MNSWNWDGTRYIIEKPYRYGSAADYMDISATGGISWVGASGLVFGSCYGNDIGWTQAGAVQNTWYNVSDADMVDGQLHGVTHDGSGLLTVTEPGMYSISYSASVECDTQNKHLETGIEVSGSGSANAAGINHIHLPNVAAMADTEWAVSCVCILDLSDNATIEFAMRVTDAGAPDIFVDHLNIVVTQVGGT